MANYCVYINRENSEKFDKVDNKSELVNKLIQDHFKRNESVEDLQKKAKIAAIMAEAELKLKEIDPLLEIEGVKGYG